MGLFGSKKAKAAERAGREVVHLEGGAAYRIARSIDCLGDSCPRPQLMTKKGLSEVGPKDIIEVLVDNPSSVEALPPMCDGLGATHLETIKQGAFWRVFIRKD
jgi:tRNA 2-thiouridine synthesizing protein A